MMRKIKILEHISLDGVIQHENDENFKHADWTLPYRSVEGREAVEEVQGSDFDLLLGRNTYDAWSKYWPKAGESAIANSLNSATKYVATHNPDTLTWGPVQDLGTNIIKSIRDLKHTAGPDLILWGSSTLTSLLLEHDLVDEIVLITYPVLLGKGKRFFTADAYPRELAFVNTRALPTGVLVNTYKPVGALRASQ